MDHPYELIGECLNCQGVTTALLTECVMASGESHYAWVCSVCHRKAPFGGALFIGKDLLTLEQRATPHVLMPEASIRCVKCGARGAELHHWAPKHIFQADADNWPKDYLCPLCHTEWHSKVTPNMHKKP